MSVRQSVLLILATGSMLLPAAVFLFGATKGIHVEQETFDPSLSFALGFACRTSPGCRLHPEWEGDLRVPAYMCIPWGYS